MEDIQVKFSCAIHDGIYRGGRGAVVDLYIQAFITSTLEGYDWSASYSGRKDPPVPMVQAYGRLNEPHSRYADGRREEPVILGFPAPSLIILSPTLSYLGYVLYCVANGAFNDTISRT